MARYEVRFAVSADKALRRLPTAVQIRIATAIADLQIRPRPAGCVKLKGEANAWRIRIGDYRVVYEVFDDVLMIMIIRIAPRKDAYRRK